jgi:diphosphomevalonate decarboxylase
MDAIKDAISRRDFPTFARITMQDSNQFHAVALDTDPPIFYLNDVSRSIIAIITEYNRAAGEIKAAYTYDAGPNAVIYAPKENVKEIVELLLRYFPQSAPFPDPFGLHVNNEGRLPDGFNEKVAKGFPVASVKGFIHTRVVTDRQNWAMRRRYLDQMTCRHSWHELWYHRYKVYCVEFAYVQLAYVVECIA